MSHMINITEKGAGMAYVGATPWHGLGQKLEQGASIDEWRVAARMDYDVLRGPVQTPVTVGDTVRNIVMPDKHLLYRSDLHTPLAVVGHRYKVVQPGEVLEFFRDLVDAAGEYDLETAGVLDDGARYWALARYRQAFAFGSDIVKPYLLLATACDGSMATTAQHTTVRVVCNNTMQLSLRSDQATSVKVSHRSVFEPDRVKAELGVGGLMESFADDVESLINKSLSRQEAVDVFVDAVAEKDSKGNVTNEKSVKRIVSDIMASLDKGPGAGLDTAHGTAWGALNAVTHYVDFKARTRGGQHNRFKSGQWGAGRDLKVKVAEMLLAA
jgi:phage/plasmid-like protein (TIGR03299 family)